MERIVLRGNSLAREMQVEGVHVVAEGGAKLEMMDRAEIEDRGLVTVFLFGIPDLFRRGRLEEPERGAQERLTRVMRRAEGRRQWVLGTFFPPRDASQPVVQVVRAVNALTTHINSANGNGTPAFHTFMFYRSGARYIMKREWYADAVHWSHLGRRAAEEKMGVWLAARRGREREGVERRRGGEREGWRERAIRRAEEQAEERVRREREECEEEIEEFKRSRREECEAQVRRIREQAESTVRDLRQQRSLSPVGLDRVEVRPGGRGLRIIRESEERDTGRGRGDLRQRIGNRREH